MVFGSERDRAKERKENRKGKDRRGNLFLQQDGDYGRTRGSDSGS